MKNINNNINKLINALDPNIKQCIGCKKWKNRLKFIDSNKVELDCCHKCWDVIVKNIT